MTPFRGDLTLFYFGYLFVFVYILFYLRHCLTLAQAGLESVAILLPHPP